MTDASYLKLVVAAVVAWAEQHKEAKLNVELDYEDPDGGDTWPVQVFDSGGESVYVCVDEEAKVYKIVGETGLTEIGLEELMTLDPEEMDASYGQ